MVLYSTKSPYATGVNGVKRIRGRYLLEHGRSQVGERSHGSHCPISDKGVTKFAGGNHVAVGK
ncbi:MAG: hypothetical protein WCL39_05660 [Armatimonadota bacterium]